MGLNRLWLPLTRRERKNMKKGKEIMKHYHDVIFPGDTVAVVVGKPWDRNKYEYLFPRGIDIIPIELTDEQIDRLDQEALVTTSEDPHHRFPVEVHIWDMKAFEKWKKKR